MPTDYLIYWMTRPLGLLFIAIAITIPFLIWRAVLGTAYSSIGSKPLAVGLIAAAIGLVAMNFTSSYIEFGRRVASGLLQESQRWNIVPGWSFYTSMLSLIVVLPLVCFIGVPASAALLKGKRLTPIVIVSLVLLLWLFLVAVTWSFPSNEWHETHRLGALKEAVMDYLPSMLLVALPFLAGIYITTRLYRAAQP